MLPNTFKLLGFLSFGIERTWWRLFQKRAVYTKFDICVFISFPFFFFGRTWWRLFQKRVVHTKLDIYVFITVVQRVWRVPVFLHVKTLF